MNETNSNCTIIENYFNIRIVDCIWENKSSLMILFNDISMKVRN